MLCVVFSCQLSVVSIEYLVFSI